MKPFYFLFFLFSITQSSHIYTTDPIIDYSNSGSFSNIGIPFKLSTPLSSDEYLNLITSFSLHTQIQKTPLNYYISNYYTPSNLFMSLSINPSECLISTSKTPTYIYTKSLDSTEYLIKFLDDQNESIGLNEGTWYVLWVNILDSNFLNLQVSKNLIQIQMKTVSSSDSNYITYDKNSVTSIFQLLDPPQTSLQMSLSFDNSEQQNLLSANNIVYIGNYF